MTVEMKKYKLSDLCDVFGRIGFRGYTVNDLVAKGEGAITFSPSDINDFTLSYDNCTYISLYKYEESPEIKVFNGDIIFTKTGSSIGKTAYVENLTEKATINPQFVVLKNFKCNGKYLFYILTSKWFQKSVWNIVVGSTVPTMSQEDLKKREIYLPERKIQDKVASVLSTIDKRIENLRAQNRVLEQTAKTIYDYTFLQCAGHQTTYNKTLNRNIPTNWEVKKLGDLLTIKNGKDHKHLKDGPFAVYGSGGLMRKVDSFLYDGESVLIPRKGTLNNVMYVDEKFWTVDTMFYTVMNKPYYGKYIYYTVRDIDFMARNSGTGVPSMTSGYLNTISIMLPDSQTLETFNNQVTPLFKKVQLNTKQIETLTTQRNTLLPLLMTGQLEVC